MRFLILSGVSLAPWMSLGLLDPGCPWLSRMSRMSSYIRYLKVFLIYAGSHLATLFSLSLSMRQILRRGGRGGRRGYEKKMEKIDIRKVTLYKIKGEELLVKIGKEWYTVTVPTNGLETTSTQLPAILLPNLAEKGDNGLLISLSGRLRGVSMARKIEEQIGAGLRTQSIEWGIEDEKRPIFTKWGTIGLRVCRGGGKER